jgi:hypothetical protein
MPTRSTKVKFLDRNSAGRTGGMIRKRPGWRKDWSRDGDRLIHVSGAQFVVTEGSGYDSVDFADETLPALYAYELAKGVDVQDIGPRLLELIAEAADCAATM